MKQEVSAYFTRIYHHTRENKFSMLTLDIIPWQEQLMISFIIHAYFLFQ